MAPQQPPRAPPRFVPTLTEVVQTPGGLPAQGATTGPSRTTVMTSPLPPVARPVAGAAASAPVSSARPPLPSAQPPAVMAQRPAPTHATSTHPATGTAPSNAGIEARRPPAAALPAASATTLQRSAAPSPTAARPLPDGFEEYMVHRVMQRVDVVLDQRLREAIATVVQEQTRSVLPRLREEIESVVRHSVYEAVADELASGAPPVPRG